MMSNSGLALMGRGEGRGENRIQDAVMNAMQSPLLLAFDPKTAKNMLINVCVGDNEQTLKAGDLDVIDEELKKYLGNANRFKRGIVYDTDPDFGDTVSITVIATGIAMKQLDELYPVDDTNLIRINHDFVYDPEQHPSDTQVEPEQIERRGANSNSNSRKFFFKEKPLLYIEKDGDRSKIEGQAAYYRAYPKDEE